jgi:hypothetical protein
MGAVAAVMRWWGTWRSCGSWRSVKVGWGELQVLGGMAVPYPGSSWDGGGMPDGMRCEKGAAAPAAAAAADTSEGRMGLGGTLGGMARTRDARTRSPTQVAATSLVLTLHQLCRCNNMLCILLPSALLSSRHFLGGAARHR